MKRILLPLLAALALPTAASAETVYLLLRESNYDNDGGYEIETVLIPMLSRDQCYSEAKKIDTWNKDRYAWICVNGK